LALVDSLPGTASLILVNEGGELHGFQSKRFARIPQAAGAADF
jgi:hypothetical protein